MSEKINIPSFLGLDEKSKMSVQACSCQTAAECGCMNCEIAVCEGYTCEACEDGCQGTGCQTNICVETGTCNTACENSCMSCQGVACQYCEVTTQRPSNWTWTTDVVKNKIVNKYNGLPSYLTAKEWNDFCARINAFRAYKSKSTISFTSVTSGGVMLASQIVKAADAINDMNPPSHISGTGGKNEPITAIFINSLAAALNSIT